VPGDGRPRTYRLPIHFILILFVFFPDGTVTSRSRRVEITFGSIRQSLCLYYCIPANPAGVGCRHDKEDQQSSPTHANQVWLFTGHRSWVGLISNALGLVELCSRWRCIGKHRRWSSHLENIDCRYPRQAPSTWIKNCGECTIDRSGFKRKQFY
jgi:hypothetical protein